MTDGLGSMSYQYDPLSRLTSETRTFTGVGNFTISYSYNLAGQLTSLADPFNGVVSYIHDAVGRTITVNGSGYGASQFLSNLKYRAWGGLRLENYGNGFSSTTSYNARLQPAGFELRNSSNQLTSAIALQYYSDGRPKFGENPFDERFDRAFSYDQAGRLWEAYSGSEARDFKNGTQGATPTGPFKQSYQYDAIGHLAGRTNRFWSQSDSYTATHVNNRNQNTGWHYDAAGNATQSGSMFFSYDAAGRNSWMAEGLVTVTQSFDGDGQVRKRVETNSGFPTTSYFVCSSVLGGKAIAEVDPWGQRQKAFIYARSKLIAIQLQGNVLWQHEKPVVGSQSESTSSGLLYFKSEPEPMGVNMGSEDPYLIEEGEPPNPDMPSLVGGSSGVGRCTLDGARFDCEQLGFLNDIGAAVPCPNGDCSPRKVFNPATQETEWRIFRAFADGREGYVPLGATSSGGGGITLGNGDEGWGELGFGPQKLGFERAYKDCLPTLGKEKAPPITQAAYIIQAADSTSVDRTLLTVTWWEESKFEFFPLTGLHTPDNLIGDIGPGQIFPGIWDYLREEGENPFGSNRGIGERFNGRPIDNLLLTGRALNAPLGEVSGPARATAAGLYRAGHIGGIGYQDRFDAFERKKQGYDDFWECLRKKGF